MRTPAGAECTFYYEDYHRGQERRECRLIARNARSARWEPALCKSCPVPPILRANSCPNMALEAAVVRRWHFWKRVRVDAYCVKHLVAVADPHVGCSHCHEERAGGAIFDLPVGPPEPPDRTA
jgi:hypothetical protein